MKYRTSVVRAYGALPAVAGTEIIPIRLKDTISSLLVLTGINVGAGARLTHGLEFISKLEIVDGSDVLLSLSGGQIDGLHFLDTGKEGCTFFNNQPSVVDTMRTRILFGRHLWDTQLALDPTRFENPQLRVTYNTNLVAAASGISSLGIIAECFDEKVISPIGFLQNREFHRFLPATGLPSDIPLPTDLTLRKLIVQAYEPGMTVGLTLGNVRLDEDNDKRIPFNLTDSELATLNDHLFGMMHVGFYMTREGAGQPVFVSPTLGGLPSVENYTGILPIQVMTMAAGRITLTTASNTDMVMGEHRGSAPYQMLAYPFGVQDDIDDWYDLTNVGDLRLRLTGGTAVPPTATLRTILQQLRRY
ncbi:hypothetical protein ES708_20437 [subsurface metagenome]